MIEIRDVRKNFQDQQVLKGVCLSAQNETIGLLGANGSGKTTLLKCILNLLDFEGNIQVSGFDVKKQSLEAKRRIGYIPQYFPMWTDLTVAEAMKFACELRRADPKRSKTLLEEFDLAAHARKSVAALSGGMRQKLSIAIALVSDPDVLLLDEPTASLDAWATQEILKILESWRGRRTVILSSHRIEEVQSVATRLVQMQHGILIEPTAEAMARLTLKGAACTPSS